MTAVFQIDSALLKEAKVHEKHASQLGTASWIWGRSEGEHQAVADAQFGVVSFDDPSTGAFATVLHHNLSEDVASVQEALNGIIASGGGDCPEYAISGISTAANEMNWRVGSQRIIFLITDADVKDENDPQDNLTDTLATLDDENITVNTLSYGDCGVGIDPTYQELANETGGVVESGLTGQDDPVTVMFDMFDGDGDWVLDIGDNCLDDPNPNQADTDGDGIANVCDSDGPTVDPGPPADPGRPADPGPPAGVPPAGRP